MRLLVLGCVVLRVLGDVAELARDADPVGDVPTPVHGQVFDLVLELLEALGRENDFLQLVLLETPRQQKRPVAAPPGGGGWYLRRLGPSTGAGLPSPHGGGTSGNLAHRPRRGAHAGRPRPDGRGERPGLPTAGPPLRRGPRLLRDGLLRRDRVSQREDPRLPPGGG